MHPAVDKISLLQSLLHRVFAESCHLETAHSELISKTDKKHRDSNLPLFQTGKNLLTHWRLLCFLAECEFRLDASLVEKLLPVLTRFSNGKNVDFSNPGTLPDKWKQALEKARQHPEVFYSFPEALFQKLSSSLGTDTETALRLLNLSTSPDLRLNPLRTDINTLRKALIHDGFRVTEVSPICLQVEGLRNLYSTEAYKSGWFEIQDRSSQLVGPFTGVKPGNRVLDACAGAGGKSLHLASLMQNKGRLIAMDIYPQKLEQLELRAKRAGVHCIETRLKTSTKTVKRLNDSMEVVLLDVPCTGTGTIRQHPEIKWSFSTGHLHSIVEEQAALLKRHATVVKAGGTLVYSTCSLLKCENDDQIDSFLENHPNFIEETRSTILPESRGGHGFFMSRLRRKS